MNELKKNIKQVAKEEGQTELEIITLLQVGANKTGNDKMMNMLCEIKNEYIEKMF